MLFFSSPFFCYPFLPYHSIIPAAKLFASILLGLFRPAIYSSPNGPVRPLVLLLHHRWAPVSHSFSLGRPRPVCFPWASSALFLTLHSHGLLLNSLGFPGPITLSLILGVHGLAINPLLSLLSLLWACRGTFSLFHIIYCPWFAFSLFLGSFKLIYLLKTHLFISWAGDPLFLPLGLNGFSIYLPNSFLSVLLGFSFPLGLPKWPSTKPRRKDYSESTHCPIRTKLEGDTNLNTRNSTCHTRTIARENLSREQPWQREKPKHS